MSKTPKGRRLAAALRNARESRGLTLRELGALTSRNSGVLSRYETGDRTPKPEDVAQLLTAMQVRGEEYEEILGLAYDTDAPDWVGSTVPDRRQQLAALADMEQSATRIDHASHSVLPGLLQSEAYATAIILGGRVSADEVANRVAFRMSRQSALARTEFVSYLGEAALFWLVGGIDVMVEQLRHVLALLELPNVHVLLVPFSSGWQPVLDGPFMVMDGSIVHMDTGSSGLFLHNRADVQVYLDAIDQLGEVAYGEAETRALLRNRLRELERAARHDS